MTETICPHCGAKCEAKVIKGMVLKTHQPDLTKLRVYHDLIVNDDIDVAIMDFSGTENIQDLWHAIKEVLDAETSNSSNNR